jgi:hypothetical protein
MKASSTTVWRVDRSLVIYTSSAREQLDTALACAHAGLSAYSSERSAAGGTAMDGEEVDANNRLKTACTDADMKVFPAYAVRPATFDGSGQANPEAIELPAPQPVFFLCGMRGRPYIAQFKVITHGVMTASTRATVTSSPACPRAAET